VPKGVPRGAELRTHRLTIRIPETLYAKLRIASAEDQRSISDYVVLVLTEQTGDIDPGSDQGRSS
jgi:predicted HicB family RNase H-like nuclease